MSLLTALEEQELSPDRGWTSANQFVSYQSQPSISRMTSPSSGASSGSWGESQRLEGLLPQPMEDIKTEATEGSEEVMLVDQTSQNQAVNLMEQLRTTENTIQIQLGDDIFSIPSSSSNQYLVPSDFSPSPAQPAAYQAETPMDYIPSPQEQSGNFLHTTTSPNVQYSAPSTSIQHAFQTSSLQQSPVQHVQQVQQTTVQRDQQTSIQQSPAQHIQQTPLTAQHLQQTSIQLSPTGHVQQQTSTTQYQHNQFSQHQYASSENSFSGSPVPSSFNSFTPSKISDQTSSLSPEMYSSSSQASSEGFMNRIATPPKTKYSKNTVQSPGMSMIREYESASPHFSENVGEVALTMSSEDARSSPVIGTPNQVYRGSPYPQQSPQDVRYNVSAPSNFDQCDFGQQHSPTLMSTHQQQDMSGASPQQHIMNTSQHQLLNTPQHQQGMNASQIFNSMNPQHQMLNNSQQQIKTTHQQQDLSSASLLHQGMMNPAQRGLNIAHQIEDSDGQQTFSDDTQQTLSVRGQNFQKGYVYLVKKSNGTGGFLAKYTANGLEPMKESVNFQGKLNASGGNIIGGGRGNTARGRGRGQSRGRGQGQMQGRPLKGNATGLLMSAADANSMNVMKGRSMHGNMANAGMLAEKCSQNNAQNILPNGRIWRHTSLDTSLLARPPLHPEMQLSPNSHGKTDMAGEPQDTPLVKHGDLPKTDINSMNDDSLMMRPRDPPKPKKQSGADGFAVCKFCGYTSGDIEQCERCHRKLPTDVKIMKKHQDGGKTIDKKSFYGARLNEQSKPYVKKHPLHASNTPKCTSPVDFNVQGVNNTYSSPRQYARPTPRTQRMSRVHEPETVTISSSDEEDASARAMIAAGQSVPHGAMMTPPYTPGTTPQQNSRNGSPSTSPCSSPFKYSAARPALTRREKMEDSTGKCPGKKRGRKPKVRQTELMTQPPPGGKMKRDISVELNVRSVRIGCMKSTPLEHVTITKDGFQFHVICDDRETEFQFEVNADEIQSCRAILKQSQPLMFLHTYEECGERLRQELSMEEPNQKGYFPDSKDVTQKYIVIIINKIEECERQDIRMLFQHYQRMTASKVSLLTDLTSDEANMLLVETTPKKNDKISKLCDKAISSLKEKSMASISGGESSKQEDKENSAGSRSPSPPPKIGFSGPIEKLLTYPPPPTKGGITITNEDLYCLNEGEFLNDVIIDFYLKYLFIEKLSEEDRSRTHIFSSFFYKRLTQKQARNSMPEDVAKLPAMIRRHTRVKTWTRHVDLFDKDFIIVPINEHSHWFLAIICFPNMNEEEHIPYIPRTPEPETPSPSTEETSEEHSKEEGEETEEGEQKEETSMDTDDSQTTVNTSPNKEIRGTPLDPSEVLNNGDETKEYSLGVKQACVLIYDSLAGPSRSAIVRILKDYLQVEWDTKKKEKRQVKDKLKGGFVKVPQQTNYSDCGVYLLQYVESFFKDPIMDFSLPMKSLKNWFKDEIVLKKRDEIRDLILELKKKEEEGAS
ncbi:uncharacterized protein LOC124111405 isoform X2 [Haliotis rufescens]|uniref:uncharacterized protein LOC124111405 isoform X1 n=2 Tax=Haliotis rufescens TaxID=6454 RepID=UPI00201EE4AA|nr:uncharacterized protein LOC124111405 isoform X1 [Haliotis rufescens]XP_048239759.1 uncharacterized protein LOC124111405 isoform X2 [Haliotis rufescens]